MFYQNYMRVGLVFGGNTTEGVVSKSSANGVRGALLKLGYEVVDIEFDKEVAMHIIDANVDVIYNSMHGQYGEDGCLQGLLNIMKIPYTHSGVLASSLAMNKIISKVIFNKLGYKTADYVVVSKADIQNDNWKEIIKNSSLKDKKEVFIKPACDGSSRDAFLIHNVEEKSFKEDTLCSNSREYLIEERIIGKEIQVAVLGDKSVGLLEVKPKDEFYDFSSKYDENGAIHIAPEMDENTKNKILDMALNIHRSFGIKDISRCEFLLTENNEIYVLETNTHPGFTPTSIVPEICLNNGITYEEIVDMLVKNARYE